MVGEDAEDVAAEAWLQIARDMRSFRGEGAGFRGWAVTVARNRALDHLRRHRSRPTLSAPIEQLVQVAGEDDTAGRAMDLLAMRSAVAWIATLPREQAEAILLRVVVGLDAEAAARVLGKRAGAVRTAAHRGLRRLARQLEADPDAGLPPVSQPSAARATSSAARARPDRSEVTISDVTKTRAVTPSDVR